MLCKRLRISLVDVVYIGVNDLFLCVDVPYACWQNASCLLLSQPDALAIGKGKEELMREGCRPDLIAHRTFDGNRPSLSLLVPKVVRLAPLLLMVAMCSSPTERNKTLSIMTIANTL